MKLKHILSENYEFFGVDTDGIIPNGSSKVGTLYDVSYQELVKWFGEPETDNGEEVSKAFWEFDVKYRESGSSYDDNDYEMVAFSIYDWKEGDTPVEQITRWNVGSQSKGNFWILYDLISHLRGE